MRVYSVCQSVKPKDLMASVEDKMDKRVQAMIYQGISEDPSLTLAEGKTAKDA